MKTKATLLIFPVLFFWFGWQPSAKLTHEAKNGAIHVKDSIIPAITDTLLTGDLNGDKIADTIFVYTPPTIASYDEKGELEYEFGCVGNNCFNSVRFSCGLPEIKIDDAVWSQVESAGDLDNDGICELLICPGWFTSTMSRVEVHSFKKGSWRMISAVDARRDDEPLVKRLVKKGKKFAIRGTDFYNDDRTIYKPIKFPK